MKERETAHTTATRGLVSTPLAKATRHVGDLWFPADEGLLRKIKSTLSSGGFDNDLRSLIREVSGDYSLFFYCLRELARIVKEDDPDAELPRQLGPCQMLEWGGLERLKKILDVEIGEVSHHHLHGINQAQTVRFQEAMISATTSERLAAHYAVDPDMAYSAALLRQLGLTLIAWNYPVVYQKAVAQTADGASLEASLTQMFGFSPTALAVNVVRHWPLPKELLSTLLDESGEVPAGEWDDEAETSAVARTISKICRVGEALARANNPKDYPSAVNDWEFARAEIERVLGRDGMRTIQEKLRENCSRYVSMVPHVFTPAFVLDPENRIAENTKEQMSRRNPYIEKCRPFLQKRLVSFYEGLRPTAAARENIQLLAREIIPACGFHAGAVFTIDPASEQLIPQLAIGQATLKRFSAHQYLTDIDVNETSGRLEDVVALGFVADAPIVRAAAPMRDPEEVAIAAPLGHSQRVGVMYLEMRSAVFQGNETQQLVHFKALVQALNDCLHLK